MRTYFTIGEISKLSNLPIKTLRYYDQIGILKPAYINKENNYRYYSIEQFMHIDIIKYCKLIGMSLEEIKKLINSDGTVESMLNTLKRQSSLLEKKIKELSDVKSYLDELEANIEETIDAQMNTVIIKYNKERKFIKYDCVASELEEFEMHLRKVIIDIENKYNETYPQLGASASYDKLVSEGKLVYTGIKSFSQREKYKREGVLPEGEYITILFDDNYKNYIKYYKEIVKYIKENNIEVVGEFNERWIMPRIDKDTKEKTLVQIEILKK